MIDEISPRMMGRLTGIAYLIVIATGVFAQGFIADRLIDFGNAGGTASSILGHATLYSIGFTIFLIEMTAQIVVSVLLYYLLKPVSRSGALMATVLMLTGSVIKIFARVFFIVPLLILRKASVFSGYDADQLSSLALALLRINNEGAAVALAFFGPATFIQGWLMLKSNFFPKWMGVLGIVGGALWTTYYVPDLGNALFMVSALIGLVGSIATIVWLMIYGVNEEKWLERNTVAASSIWN